MTNDQGQKKSEFRSRERIPRPDAPVPDSVIVIWICFGFCHSCSVSNRIWLIRRALARIWFIDGSLREHPLPVLRPAIRTGHRHEHPVTTFHLRLRSVLPAL